MSIELTDPETVGFSAERLTRINRLTNRYVNSGKLAGIVTCVARRDQIVHFEKAGCQDIKSRTPMELDTIFRVYSMTKPVTCTALMMLYEESLFNLRDRVSKYISAFEDVRVMAEGGVLVEPLRPITIQDLMRHTAGLSYGGYEESNSAVDKLYDEADLFNPGLTNQEITARIARLPLMFHPGEKWHYSMATDVAGHMAEILSGRPLADFMKDRIFDPLGMVDTAFFIEPDRLDRFATLYGKTPDDDLGILDEPATSEYSPPIVAHAGGHGLVSTAADYLRFAQCLLNKGQLEGVRLLGPKTVALMTGNHLPADLLPIAFEGTEPMLGMGYGLGFGVMLDVAQTGHMGSAGDISWGGHAETYFWIDPQEELIAILMAQYMPSMTYPIRQEFRTAVYQALIE
ncbi:MAG: beta-lactamase family protein [Chloroflexota bacterium]|nr:MAG: beta-lactamase family protein [Chloroflexota bacterium]